MPSKNLTHSYCSSHRKKPDAGPIIVPKPLLSQQCDGLMAVFSCESSTAYYKGIYSLQSIDIKTQIPQGEQEHSPPETSQSRKGQV
jgi:hypothetical protein